MKKDEYLTINNRSVLIEGERNILELVRKADIDIPTFCYYSEMSIYGACRLCMVEIEGRGILPSCSTLPEAGLKIKTNTKEIRSMRKTIVELLLANHGANCTTCDKGAYCQLQSLARKLGVEEIRFKKTESKYMIDDSSKSLRRDPNKCVLCGDCVRMCSEIQQVGAIDFAFRGSQTQVMPAFDKKLGSVECINCGQCARVCPTGAITPKSDKEDVWDVIYNKNKYVVAQVAPAVRVAIGEAFNLECGDSSTNKIVASLKSMGVNKVYDTSYTADLTVIEESTEFLKRFEKKEKLPLFTSCCPGWVKFAEQYYPEYLDNLSTCKSPQQMFGSLCKDKISKDLGIKKEDIVLVSIMPCTAKKFEISRFEFQKDGIKEVDFVLTTQELIHMIEETGINFNLLEPESFDMPFSFKTGAGVIFGNSGGVTEAVLRYASEKITGCKSENFVFKVVRGNKGIKETKIKLNNIELNIAIVSNLGNARKVIQMIKNNEKKYDLIEVMACDGGCIGGAGQPVSKDKNWKIKRTNGLYENDITQVMHKSQENPHIEELYKNYLDYPGSKKSHELLHTSYNSRKRSFDDGISILNASEIEKVEITICFGTGCFIKGSQELLQKTIGFIKNQKIEKYIELKTSFCFEKCSKGPVVRINDEIFEECTYKKIEEMIKRQLIFS
ncbi:MAG: [FeFe] hydrogenase, group A [Clostridiales bacterium]